MAKRYCDHGLYGTPVAAGTVPTAAEDGNGKAIGAATMATLIVAFSGLPSADQAITIAGVTFTAKASGASGNQFDIGADAATTATNLKNAINASTTNAVQPVGAIAATAPLRNVVNACVSGGTVTVYTRCAGSEWNSVTESSTLSNCTVTQWSGGADGAWGYFVNPATIAWPTSQSAGNYGVFSNSLPPYLQPNAGDHIYIRGGKTIALTSSIGSTAIKAVSVPTSTIDIPTIYEVDDGTEWSGDSATAEFLVTYVYVAGSCGVTLNAAGKPFVFIGKKYSDNSYRARISADAQYGFSITCGYHNELVGVKIENTNGGANAGFSFNSSSADDLSKATCFRECRFETPANSKNWFNANDSYNNQTFMFSECLFSNFGASQANINGLLAVSQYSQRYHLYFDSCKFIDFVAGSRLYPSASTDVRRISYWFRNCDFGNVSVLGPNIAAWTGVDWWDTVAASSQFGHRDFFIDNPWGFVEWNSNRSFPYCNAKLLDGVTGWSIHVIPTTQSGRNSRFQFAETPRIGKINSLADGVRTLTIPLAIHESLSWDKSHISAVIDYLDTDGNRQVVDTYDYDGGALDVSTDTWNQEVGGQVTYVDGSTQYHDKYKFSVTTPTAIATGTEIGIVIRCHTYVADTTKGFFIDPEIQVV